MMDKARTQALGDAMNAEMEAIIRARQPLRASDQDDPQLTRTARRREKC